MPSKFDLASVETAFAQASIDPTRWDAAMEIAAASTEAAGAALFCMNGNLPGAPHSASLERTFETYVNDGWINHDERHRLMPIVTRRGVATELDMFTPDAISKLPYYQDFLAPHGLRWFAGVKIAAGGFSWVLSLQRSIAQGPFSPEQVRLLADVSMRLGASAAISRMLGFARIEAALDAFEVSKTPAIVFDARGNVLRLNLSAETLLGGDLGVTGRRLVSYNRDATRTFELALREVMWIASPAASVPPIALPRRGRRPLLAYLLRLKSVTHNPLAPGQAVATIIDPEAHYEPEIAALNECFGLTPAESRLAQKLSIGQSLDTFALDRGISYETARNQLKALFAKTQTHRQPELMALLAMLRQAPRTVIGA
ncbi:helix-turn-helix transcriptional regulator [Rhizobium leguminosarum]|uniref:helix-turn-helix transcriptional regulator n=1 Tax=Rhizobium leguminosarum TaxID=384 RepID=UPI001C948F62|nr:helix-turn-helix transcriptional regulator [Rhizobium leguminosarum]MBY5797403.1 helix-turn-helix transcriptional regulator [Rhizobium leguminosarum]